MADNILRGTIKIDAPGVKETFTSVSNSVANIQKELGAVPAAAKQATDGIATTFSGVTGIDLPPVRVPIEKPDTSQVKSSLDNIGNNIRPVAIPLDTTEAQTKAKLLTSTLETLEAKLGAKREFIKVETDVTKLAITNKQIQDLEKEIQRLKSIGKSGFDDFGNRIDAFSNKIDPMSKRMGVATQSTINFGRIIQDLPYGFIGVANNLNPMLEGLQRLRAETGSIGGAVKAFGSSLIGAGGIGIAISVVSSLLVVFGDKLFSTGNAAKTQAERLKEARQALEDYVEGLNDLDKALVKGKQSAQEELVKLRTLYEATQNANIPLAERKKLVDELQDQYPKYFKNISDETILAGGAKKAYDQLTTAIIASAKARAAQDSIVDIQKDVLTVEQQISQNAAEQIKLQQQLNALKSKAVISDNDTDEERSAAVVAAANAYKIQLQLNGIISKGNELRKQKNDLDTRSNQLANAVKTTVEKTPEALTDPTGNEPKAPKVKFEKVNFFDEFLDFDPKKVKDKSEDAIKSYDIFLKFALENQKSLIGLDEILKIESKPAAIKSAAEWWEAYSKAWDEGRVSEFRKVITNIEVKPKIKLDQKEVEKSLFDSLKELSSKKIDLKPTITIQADTELEKEFTDFKRVGESIGRSIGGGFDEVFKKIFADAFTNAVATGLSGDALDNFKTEFVAFTNLASEGIVGIADSFAKFTDALLQGQNGMQAFGQALKGVFRGIAVEIIKDIVLAGILSALSGGASGGGLSFLGAFKKILGGSHATGLKSVPYDGYLAELHKDEMVVPAKQARELRPLMKSDFSMPSLSGLTQSVSFKGINANSIVIPKIGTAQVNKTPAIKSMEVERVPYIAGFDISHDKVRLMINRANSYGKTFGR